MAWDQVGEARWVYSPDEVRHQLLLASGVLHELHGQWLHRYRAPDPVAEQPLDGATYIDTAEFAEPRITTDEQGWAYLASVAGRETT